MFQPTEKEVEIKVSQNCDTLKQHLGGYLPYTFTERGLPMFCEPKGSNIWEDEKKHLLEDLKSFKMGKTFINAACML